MVLWGDRLELASHLDSFATRLLERTLGEASLLPASAHLLCTLRNDPLESAVPASKTHKDRNTGLWFPASKRCVVLPRCPSLPLSTWQSCVPDRFHEHPLLQAQKNQVLPSPSCQITVLDIIYACTTSSAVVCSIFVGSCNHCYGLILEHFCPQRNPFSPTH
jgi:hypothetical protein